MLIIESDANPARKFVLVAFHASQVHTNSYALTLIFIPSTITALIKCKNFSEHICEKKRLRMIRSEKERTP
jgi:hypothetical protein